MQRLVAYVSVCVLAGFLIISPQTHAVVVQPPAQACVGDPLQVLVGTWTFSMQGFVDPTTTTTSINVPFSSAGQFVAGTVATTAGRLGVLDITTTSVNNGKVTTIQTGSGTYAVFSDCSGGTLTFNLLGSPSLITFDFWFVRGSPTISIVSATPGFTITGTAEGDKPPGVVFFTCTSGAQCTCSSTTDCFDLGSSGECKSGTFTPGPLGSGQCTYRF
jgi:hypothetical protein